MTEQTPYPLGRIQRHDPRSLNYPALLAGEVKTVTHRHYGPVLDQGKLGSCTGNAMAQWLNCTPAHKPRTRYLTEEDAIRIYCRATVIDPFPGEMPTQDTGSDGISVCKAAIEEKRISGYTWAFGRDQVLAALTLSPVLIGTVWTQGMFTPKPDGSVVPTGDIVGGHEYLLIGLNLERGYVTALNSWGSGWALRGRFRISFDNLTILLNQGGDVTVPVL